MRRRQTAATAHCARTLLLLLLLLWLPLLQLGPGAERFVLMAHGALRPHSPAVMASQPGQGCMGTALRALVESCWSPARGAALLGRGARPVGQLRPRAGTQSQPGPSPRLCAVFRALSQGQRGAHGPPQQQETTAKGLRGQGDAGSPATRDRRSSPLLQLPWRDVCGLSLLLHKSAHGQRAENPVSCQLMQTKGLARGGKERPRTFPWLWHDSSV